MFKFLFNRSFFHERTMIVLFIVTLIALVVNIILVFVELDPSNYPVPTRYSDFSNSPLERDNWQSLRALPLFAVVSTVFNLIIAVKIHSSRRDISIAVVAASLFILFVNLFVSWSLLSLI